MAIGATKLSTSWALQSGLLHNCVIAIGSGCICQTKLKCQLLRSVVAKCYISIGHSCLGQWRKFLCFSPSCAKNVSCPFQSLKCECLFSLKFVPSQDSVTPFPRPQSSCNQQIFPGPNGRTLWIGCCCMTCFCKTRVLKTILGCQVFLPSTCFTN